MRSNYFLVAVLIALLTGCAGYNTTMFMTKSNVGLDFDSKPPTAEINVSRKEVVIAPAFEMGQTPPVMASFKPHTGWDSGYANFFLGVDQTFAGGDAAQAMSQLYSDPTSHASPNNYDSVLKLSRAPNYKCPLWKVPGPGETRPFFFGTDTMLGLKVAWSGTGGQIPDTVKLGFNRKEFAWAPLSGTNDTNDLATPFHVKMPSFLATIESQIGAGSTGGISSLQYFATGSAATLLALQQDVRKAMLQRLDPNRTKYRATFGGQNFILLSQVLYAMDATFAALAPFNSLAVTYTNQLEHLEGVDVPASFKDATPPLYHYKFSTGAGPTSTLIEDPEKVVWNNMNTVGQITAYNYLLHESIDAIRTALSVIKTNPASVVVTNLETHTSAPEDSKETTLLKGQLDSQERALAQLQERVATNQYAIAAYGYFQQILSTQ